MKKNPWYERLMDKARMNNKTYMIRDRQDQRLYLERLHLHPRWLTLGLFRVSLHRLWSSDNPDDGFHNHPWPFVSIILNGGYKEYTYGHNKPKIRLQGDVILAKANHFHRIELLERRTGLSDGSEAYVDIPCYTLFIMGPRWLKTDWGFLINGKFIDHSTWLRKRKTEFEILKYIEDEEYNNELKRSLTVHYSFNRMPPRSIKSVALSKYNNYMEEKNA